MRNIIDWIQGDKFQALAKFVFAPQCGGFPIDDYRGLTNTLDINLLQDYDIIYTHTFYVKEFFKVIKDVNKKFILISHSCDSNIDESYIIPDNLIKWYSHTFKIIDPRCIRVPLGQENDRRDFGVMKKEKMDAKLREIRNIENLVYVNHVIENNPESRTYPYQYFKDTVISYLDSGEQKVYKNKTLYIDAANSSAAQALFLKQYEILEKMNSLEGSAKPASKTKSNKVEKFVIKTINK